MTWLFLILALGTAEAKPRPLAAASESGKAEMPRPPPSAPAADLFARLKPFVMQLRTAVREDAPKRSYGSAFVVGKDGLLLTNYHVVSDVVQFPKKYKIFVEGPQGPVEAKLRALDVIHDLAVVQVPIAFPEKLTLASAQPRQGSRLYSLGLPHDLNLSIIEGVFNASLVHGPYEELHLSSPINSGMSGGPTVDPDGQVVGVNVAILRESQNVSFAVPAVYAVKLLAEVGRQVAAADGIPPWQHQIETQLSFVQNTLMADLESAGQKGKLAIETWRVPKPPEYLKCWGDDASETKREFTGYRQICMLPFSSFLATSLYSGSFELRYEVYQPGVLNRLQFASLINSRYNHVLDLASEFLGEANEENHRLLTDPQCQERRFRNRSGVEIKLNYCVRGYLHYPELVDADFKWVTPEALGPVLIAKGTVRGFTRDNLKRFFSLQWEGTERAAP